MELQLVKKKTVVCKFELVGRTKMYRQPDLKCLGITPFHANSDQFEPNLTGRVNFFH